MTCSASTCAKGFYPEAGLFPPPLLYQTTVSWRPCSVITPSVDSSGSLPTGCSASRRPSTGSSGPSTYSGGSTARGRWRPGEARCVKSATWPRSNASPPTTGVGSWPGATGLWVSNSLRCYASPYTFILLYVNVMYSHGTLIRLTVLNGSILALTLDLF